MAVLIGSLRAQSWSRKLAAEIIRRSREKLTCHVVEIGDLPLYNEDLDEQPPANWLRFRGEIAPADAVLFVTPEYNRSIPGALKNALDVGSRPSGQNLWAGKPVAVVSQTPYKLGAFGANHALRQTFAFLDMAVLQQPEMYIGTIGEKFDPSGKLTDGETGKLLDAFIDKFGDWIARLHGAGDSDSFRTFLKQREEIATAYVNGDGAPLDAIVTRNDPATFMSPRGDVLTGAAAIVERYATDAANFVKGSSSKLEIVHAESGQLGLWTGIQHAEVKSKGDGAPVPMALRVTEVYRLDGKDWKLIHRHADVSKPK